MTVFPRGERRGEPSPAPVPVRASSPAALLGFVGLVLSVLLAAGYLSRLL